MSTTLKLFSILLFGFFILVSAKDPKPKEVDNVGDMFAESYETINGSDFYYIADTITGQCFAVIRAINGGGITTIPCESLAKRVEWKSILKKAE